MEDSSTDVAPFDEVAPLFDTADREVAPRRRRRTYQRDYAAERARAKARHAAKAADGPARQKTGQRKGLEAAIKARAKQKREKAAAQGMTVAEMVQWKRRMSQTFMAVYYRIGRDYPRARAITLKTLEKHPEFKRQAAFDKDRLIALSVKAAGGEAPIEQRSANVEQRKRRAKARALKKLVSEDETATRTNGAQPKARRVTPPKARSDATGATRPQVHDEHDEHRTRAEEKHVSYAFGHVEEWLTQYARGANISWPALAGGVAELLQSTVSR